MIVAIHQPNYVPWLGYFHKIARADVFVFLDDVQYTKNSYINRAKILDGGGGRWLTVPVAVHLGDAINAVRPARADWKDRHLDTLKHFYGKAAAFRAVWDDLRALYDGAPDADLAAINMHLVRALAHQLGLTTRFVASSDLDTGDLAGSDRLVRIVGDLAPGGTYLSGRGGANYQDEGTFTKAGLTLAYADFEHPAYGQGGDAFVAGLSVLDAVCHLGFAAAGDLVKAAPGAVA